MEMQYGYDIASYGRRYLFFIITGLQRQRDSLHLMVPPVILKFVGKINNFVPKQYPKCFRSA